MPAARLATALLCLLAGCHALPSPTDERAPHASAEPALQATEPAPGASTSSPSPVPSLSAEMLSPEMLPAERLPAENTGVQTAAYNQPAEPTPAPAREPLRAPAPSELPATTSTLDELESLALANNPTVAQAAARVAALRGRWVQAGLPPNPTLGYRGEEIGDAGTAGLQGGFVGQQFVTGGKLGLDQEVVAQQIRQAEQQWIVVQQRVLTDVRLAYYDVLIAQRRVELTQELVRISREAVEASSRLLNQGEIPRVALLQTEVEAGTTQILLQRAENEIAAAWRRLTSVLGTPDMLRVRLAGDLETPPALDFERQLERIVSRSPEVAAAAADLAEARWAVERAYAEVVPDINAQAAVLHDNASGDTVASVQIALPLPLWNRNQGGIQEARQQVAAARQNVTRATLSLRERLATAFQQYADARYQIEIYSAEILPKARQTLDLVTTGYNAGEIGYLDLLTAQRSYFQTTLAYIDALRELWGATLRIEGLLLEGSLQQPAQPVR